MLLEALHKCTVPAVPLKLKGRQFFPVILASITINLRSMGLQLFELTPVWISMGNNSAAFLAMLSCMLNTQAPSVGPLSLALCLVFSAGHAGFQRKRSVRAVTPNVHEQSSRLLSTVCHNSRRKVSKMGKVQEIKRIRWRTRRWGGGWREFAQSGNQWERRRTLPLGVPVRAPGKQA